MPKGREITTVSNIDSVVSNIVAGSFRRKDSSTASPVT